MPRARPFPIILSRDEQSILQRRARKYTSSYLEVVRAKIVLFAAQGMQNKDIADRVDTSPQLVCKWRKRLFEQRLQDFSFALSNDLTAADGALARLARHVQQKASGQRLTGFASSKRPDGSRRQSQQ